MKARVALVTGGNRGIGYEVCRQLALLDYTVLMGSRDLHNGEDAAKTLRSAGDIRAIELDVSDSTSVENAANYVKQQFGHLDVLINNAAILYDTWQHASNADLAQVHQAFNTNTLGAWRMVQAFLPLLRKGTHVRIVNVSSEAGSLNGMSSNTPAYNISKVALNALTVMLANELRHENMLVNAVCPGWTNTDMGKGGRPVSAGAASVVWAVTLPDDWLTGGFYRDGEPLMW
jgi:NAD(P)-dependent dehydrogenase (short-subunit alcohol dehydrogenase family)